MVRIALPVDTLPTTHSGCADHTTNQPHADSSYFSTSQEPTKAEVYAQVLEQAKGLVTGQRNWVSIPLPFPPFTLLTQVQVR